MGRSFTIASIAATLIFAASCSTNVAKHSVQTSFSKNTTSTRTEVRQLVTTTVVSLRSGFSSSSLKVGSNWKHVGSITEGRVYQRVDGVLMVRTGHAHEAYIVVSSAELVGVYLPVEQVFVACRRPVPIQLVEVP